VQKTAEDDEDENGRRRERRVGAHLKAREKQYGSCYDSSDAEPVERSKAV
jgi:hypothetical protein